MKWWIIGIGATVGVVGGVVFVARRRSLAAKPAMTPENISFPTTFAPSPAPAPPTQLFVQPPADRPNVEDMQTQAQQNFTVEQEEMGIGVGEPVLVGPAVFQQPVQQSRAVDIFTVPEGQRREVGGIEVVEDDSFF